MSIEAEISGGTARFLKRVNRGNYEHEEAEFTIGFGGATAEHVLKNLELAAHVAKVKTLHLLGIAIAGAVVPLPQLQPAPDVKVETTTAAETAASTTRKAGRPPKTTPAADTAPVTQHVADVITDAKPPASLVDVTEDDAAELFKPTAPEVTDDQLNKACVETNKRTGNPPAIRALIGQYVAPPGTVRDIPQVKRNEFLEKMKEIPPAVG